MRKHRASAPNMLVAVCVITLLIKMLCVHSLRHVCIHSLSKPLEDYCLCARPGPKDTTEQNNKLTNNENRTLVELRARTGQPEAGRQDPWRLS